MEQTELKKFKQSQKEEPQFQFPTEEVTLPSKGLLYEDGNPLKSGKSK